MGKGGGSTESKGASAFQPWREQIPYLKQLYSEAQAQYGKPMEYYPESTVAGRSEQTEQAIGRTTARAGEGSENLQGAQDLNLRTMRGDFLGGSPILDEQFGRAAGQITQHYNRSVLNDLESRFAGGGARRSGAYQGALSRSQGELGGALTDAASDVYYKNYQAERGAQERAIGQGAQLAREDYYDIDRLAGAGQQEDTRLQDVLNDLVKRWNFEQGEPWERMGLYQEAIGGPIAGGGTTSQSTGPGNIDWGRGLSQMIGFG